MYHYIKDGDIYKLIDDDFDVVVCEGHEVAVMFDKACGTLLKHGDPELVILYFNKTINTYAQSENCADIMADLVVLVSNEWDVEILNKCLSITGYPQFLGRDLGIDLGKPVRNFKRGEKGIRIINGGNENHDHPK